ncbi:hypothetical protein ABZ464_51605 [Streptomyces sp. NPDC005820]|uniref:hypothetical protein n=1 Tax=Streptomyces sp. NPDC005820 TaxID=3157069 RepID=UPI0033C80729
MFTPDATGLTGLNQEDIGRLQIEHLEAQGHRHIGYAALDDPRERPFFIGADDLSVSSLGVPAPTTIGMDLTAAAGNLTAGILSTVGVPAPAAPSRPVVGDILALIRRETT